MQNPVTLSVYPDGTVIWEDRGTRYHYNGSNILIFIDEKGGFHPFKKNKKDLYPEMFMTLAVVIDESEMCRFTDRFHAFKLQVRPDAAPDSWEIKGKGYRKANGEWTSREDAVQMWKLFSQFLKALDISWYVHAVVANRDAVVKANACVDWGCDSTTHAFVRVNLAALLWNCIALRVLRTTTIESRDYTLYPSVEVHDFQVFYDRLSDRKITRDFDHVFRFCLEQDPVIRGLIDTWDMNAKFIQLGFYDHGRRFAGIEFADMVLYLLYNFIAGRDVAGMSEDHMIDLKYYQPMLHRVRHRIARSVFLGKSEISSVVRISDVVDHTFGKLLYDKLSTGISTRIQI